MTGWITEVANYQHYLRLELDILLSVCRLRLLSILLIFSGYRLQNILIILDGILLLTLIFCLFLDVMSLIVVGSPTFCSRM